MILYLTERFWFYYYSMACEGVLNMKYILLENAYEAWAMAIDYCNRILKGQVTLQNQKYFVSSLHNAVELFIKQMMLNKGDHSVAMIPDSKNQGNAELLEKYNNSASLNEFFAMLDAEALKSFRSIEFHKIINTHQEVMKQCLKARDFTRELKVLIILRNNETHFLISKSEFLTENQFTLLHNFMIDFFAVLDEMKLLPFWGEPFSGEKRLYFRNKPIAGFSYKLALRQSTKAQRIAKILNGSNQYGSPYCSAYEIAENVYQDSDAIDCSFEELWAIIDSMISLNVISYQEDSVEYPDETSPTGTQKSIIYFMLVSL